MSPPPSAKAPPSRSPSRRLGPFQHLLDRLHQRMRTEGFRQVVLRTRLHRRSASLLVLGGHDDDGDAGGHTARLESLEQIRARDPGHVQIQQDEVRAVARDQLQGSSAVGGFIDGEAFIVKYQAHGLAHRGVVIDDEDPGSHRAQAEDSSRSANTPSSKGRRSSGRSPTPTNRTGTPSSSRTANTMPPFAEPSVFVSTTPVIVTPSVNARACAIPFCPVWASSTRNVSSTAAPAFLITRPIFDSSSINGCFVCRRPAVSTINTSTPRASEALTASNATAPGSAPRSWAISCAPATRAQISSCAPAAARNVSAAATLTIRPSETSRFASFPIVVVFPEPLTPTTRITESRPSSVRGRSGPRIERISARTVSTTLPPVGWSARTRCTMSEAALGPTSAFNNSSSSSCHVVSVAAPWKRPFRVDPRPPLWNAPPEAPTSLGASAWRCAAGCSGAAG